MKEKKTHSSSCPVVLSEEELNRVQGADKEHQDWIIIDSIPARVHGSAIRGQDTEFLAQD